VLGTANTAMTAEGISDRVVGSFAVAVSKSCVVARLSVQAGLGLKLENATSDRGVVPEAYGDANGLHAQ
jgi:hypothetical protein